MTKKILISFIVDYGRLMTHGFPDATEDLRLTDDGKVIIPVRSPGFVMHNPAPCGDWEVIDE